MRDYYALAKPGIIFGNIVTLAGGFAVAAKGRITLAIFALLLETLAGLSLVIASGGVFNNIIDRDIDATMERTKNRELVTGIISPRAAITYGICLGGAGFFILLVYANFLTAGIAAFGLFAYIVLYSLWVKRRTVYGPVIGSIAGAVPPVVGYTAMSGRFDAGAAILFTILFLWQVPHFLAIAIYRLDDYAAAKIPVMPAEHGIRATKINMLIYIIAFTVSALALAVFGYAGRIYFTIAVSLGAAWLGLCMAGFRHQSGVASGSDGDVIAAAGLAADKRWARKMFFLSLAVLMALFVMMSVDVATK